MEAPNLLQAEPQNKAVHYRLKAFNFVQSNFEEKKHLAKWFQAFLNFGINVFRFLFVGPRLVRKQGPDLPHLERHEFEAPKMNGPFQW